jgi:hypothetical protein
MIDRHQCHQCLGIMTIDRFYELRESLDRMHCCVDPPAAYRIVPKPAAKGRMDPDNLFL